MYKAIIDQKLDERPLDRYYQNGKLVKDFVKKCFRVAPCRPDASTLLNDPWIKAMVEDEYVDSREQVMVGMNMANFSYATLFQSSVITFLVRLKSDKEEMSKIRRVFTKLDKNHDGFLSTDEI